MFWLFKYKATKYSNKVNEEFQDIKGVIRIRKSKKNNTMAKRKMAKGQTTIYKTLRIKLKIE